MAMLWKLESIVNLHNKRIRVGTGLIIIFLTAIVTQYSDKQLSGYYVFFITVLVTADCVTLDISVGAIFHHTFL